MCKTPTPVPRAKGRQPQMGPMLVRRRGLFMISCTGHKRLAYQVDTGSFAGHIMVDTA